VLSLTARDFVLSAKAAGATDGWIIRHHILPNTLTPAFVQAAIIVPSFILGEAALSFLGVGIQEPQPSWGNMLAAAQDLTVLLNSWWILTPGVAIFITVAAFTALGDAIRDALDPRWRGRPQGWG
jgi:peptide/nickel transport system permease protein